MRALLVLLALLAPVTARADDSCPVTPDATADEIAAQASERYERGSVLYFQGDYEGAVREYAATLCLLPSATDVLYSIGQAYERLLEFEQAISYYQRFVAIWAKADPELQKQVTQVKTRLTQLLAEERRIGP